MDAITATTDVSTPINILSRGRTRDIPGGGSIKQSTLISGNVVDMATPVTDPTSGVRTVCKQAVILTGSSNTAVKVTNGKHNFKVGDFIGTKEAGKAYAITGITTANGVDTLNVGTAIDTVTTGGYIYEMAAEAASNTSALKNVPTAITGVAFKVDTSKVMVAIPLYCDATITDVIGSVYLGYLKGITVVKY